MLTGYILLLIIVAVAFEEHQIEFVPIDRPTLNPRNEEVYSDREDLSDSFVESIRKDGILQPLVVAADWLLISGHRRLEAAKRVGFDEVPVIMREFTGELERLEALVQYNLHREKTYSQKMREAELLAEVEAERAKRRQGTRTDLRENLPTSGQREYGRTRDKVASAVGLGSGKTYEKALAVWNAAELGDPVAKGAVTRLDTGDSSIESAWRKVRKRHPTDGTPNTRETAKSNGEQIDPNDLILSAHQAHNDVVFKKILDLHVERGSVVADVTFNEGTFWKQVPHDAYTILATDINPKYSPYCEAVVDYRDLPYEDNNIDAVVLDPPYAEGFYSPSEPSDEDDYWIKERYGDGSRSEFTYHEAVINEYVLAGREAHRVLADDGVLIVKLQDEVSRNQQRLTHVEVTNIYEQQLGFTAEDLFVVVRPDRPTFSNIKRQRRARKNHSYFIVYKKQTVS